MRVKMRIDLKDGRPAREMTTNMLAIVEWEKTENRRSADGKGIGLCRHVLLGIHPVQTCWRQSARNVARMGR
jgi:hypothetical protein